MKNSTVERLESIYNLALAHEDLKSMLRAVELLHKVSDESAVSLDDIPSERMDEIIEYLQRNLISKKSLTFGIVNTIL